jgi:hypothetical protein
MKFKVLILSVALFNAVRSATSCGNPINMYSGAILGTKNLDSELTVATDHVTSIGITIGT